MLISVAIMNGKPVCNERDCTNTDARVYVRGNTMRTLCMDCVDRFCETCGVRFDEYNEAVAVWASNGDLVGIVCDGCAQ